MPSKSHVIVLVVKGAQKLGYRRQLVFVNITTPFGSQVTKLYLRENTAKNLISILIADGVSVTRVK